MECHRVLNSCTRARAAAAIPQVIHVPSLAILVVVPSFAFPLFQTDVNPNALNNVISKSLILPWILCKTQICLSCQKWLPRRLKRVATWLQVYCCPQVLCGPFNIFFLLCLVVLSHWYTKLEILLLHYDCSVLEYKSGLWWHGNLLSCSE